MRLLVSGATKDVAKYPECGILVTPGNGNSISGIAKSGRVWAADNAAFGTAWDEAKFLIMLAKISLVDRSKFLWVTCPDVVCKAQETIDRWNEWFPRMRHLGIPVAFVIQDGVEYLQDQIPWEDMAALFIGGSTDYKLSPEAEALGRKAKFHGKLLHVGRVNSERRIKHCLEIGADSIDGTGFSRWPKRIPMGLRWIRYHQQQPVMF